MTDAVTQFEESDLTGSTAHFNGTATTSVAAVPSVAGNIISEVAIENVDQSASGDLLVSFDGGVKFKTLSKGQSIAWSLKGGLRQFHVKTTAGSVAYESIVNRELY